MGDLEGRASLLEKAGQQELATLTRKIHHLDQEDFAREETSDLGQLASQTAQLLQPPPPLMAADFASAVSATIDLVLKPQFNQVDAPDFAQYATIGKSFGGTRITEERHI